MKSNRYGMTTLEKVSHLQLVGGGYSLPEKARQAILAAAPGYQARLELDRQRNRFIAMHGNAFGTENTETANDIRG